MVFIFDYICTKVYEKKNSIGFSLFLISAILLIMMFFSPLNDIFVHIDERYTFYLLNLSFWDSFELISIDVHPPLYYFINEFIVAIFSLLNINVDLLRVYKLISLIPFIILIICSGTKIQKEYNWFSAGLFSYSLATMSCFYMNYLTARMYTWVMLFCFMSFICLKNILSTSDKKTWILFVSFNVLGMYTQYLVFFIVALYYLLILLNIYLNKPKVYKIELKKVFISIIVSVITYIPGLFLLFNQLVVSGHGNGQKFLSFNRIFDMFAAYSIDTVNSSLTFTLIKLLAIILLFSIIVLLYKQYVKSKKINDYYLFGGSLLLITLILIGILILPFIFGGLNSRYLLPVFAIFWFIISIYLGLLKNKKLFTILLVIILLLSFCSIYHNLNETNKKYKEQQDEKIILNILNSNKNVIIFSQKNNAYHNYNVDLNNTKQYALKLSLPYETDCIIENNISKIVKDNPDKNIYIIKNKNIKLDTYDDLEIKPYYQMHYSILKVNKKQ